MPLTEHGRDRRPPTAGKRAIRCTDPGGSARRARAAR